MKIKLSKSQWDFIGKQAGWMDWGKKKEQSELEIARTTNDPKILTEILKRGIDDEVSQNAVKNPNCPKEILVEILSVANWKEKDDFVSQYAACNPNCPKEVLIEIVKRGKANWVSLNAALNPNCPQEMLKDFIYKILRDPNCPKEILLFISKFLKKLKKNVG